MLGNTLNIIEGLSKGTLYPPVQYINTILDVNVDDIKKDANNGHILRVLNTIEYFALSTTLEEKFEHSNASANNEQEVPDVSANNEHANSPEDAKSVPDASADVKHANSPESVPDAPADTEQTIPDYVLDVSAKPSKYSLLNIYLNAKEIVVVDRKRRIDSAVKLSDAFDLDLASVEFAYFLLVMYFFGLKLNDTKPMIPGLFKALLRTSVVGMYSAVYIDIMLNKETDWSEKNLDNISKESLEGTKHDTLIPGLFMHTVYVSKENVDAVIKISGTIWSKYIPFNDSLSAIISAISISQKETEKKDEDDPMKIAKDIEKMKSVIHEKQD